MEIGTRAQTCPRYRSSVRVDFSTIASPFVVFSSEKADVTMNQFKPGQRVRHRDPKFGVGTISLASAPKAWELHIGEGPHVTVRFDNGWGGVIPVVELEAADDEIPHARRSSTSRQN